MYFTAAVILASTLVLRSGDRIVIDGPVREQDGVVVFRTSGALFSIPAIEIDTAATKTANEQVAAPRSRGKLKVSPAERDRLLRDLATNHAGRRGPAQKWEKPDADPSASAPATASPKEPENSSEEWRWRRDARAYEESVRQAKENLQLLRDRSERLRGEIRGFLSLGYRPQNFTYQTTQLARTEEQIPAAELEVTRAQRAWDQFREDARRQGILPGWLR